MRKTDVNNPNRAEELMDAVRSIFGTLPFSARMYVVKEPTRMCLELSYTDFVCESTLSKMLKPYLPAGIRLKLCRELSDKVVSGLLMSLYKDNGVAVVDCCNGSFEVEPIRKFVAARMKYKEFL